VGARVSLYEDAEGRLLLHRGGSPYIYLVADPASGRFPSDAAEVAAGEPERWDGDVLVVSALSADRWSEMTAQLVAWWEDGWVSGLAQVGGVVEASAQARRYIGPPGPAAQARAR
jgi:hypothetical protein